MAFKDWFVKSDRPEQVDGEDIDSILQTLPSNKTPSSKAVPTHLTQMSEMENGSVDNIYLTYGMTENKIYDVSAFIDSLPMNMDVVSKKTSLSKILQAAKYDIEGLKANADQCI